MAFWYALRVIYGVFEVFTVFYGVLGAAVRRRALRGEHSGRRGGGRELPGLHRGAGFGPEVQDRGAGLREYPGALCARPRSGPGLPVRTKVQTAGDVA